MPHCKHGTHSFAKCSCLEPSLKQSSLITEQKYALQQVSLHQKIFYVIKSAGISLLKSISFLLAATHLAEITRPSCVPQLQWFQWIETKLDNITCHSKQEFVFTWSFVLWKIIKQTAEVFPTEGTFSNHLLPSQILWCSGIANIVSTWTSSKKNSFIHSYLSLMAHQQSFCYRRVNWTESENTSSSPFETEVWSTASDVPVSVGFST